MVQPYLEGQRLAIMPSKPRSGGVKDNLVPPALRQWRNFRLEVGLPPWSSLKYCRPEH